MTGIRETARRRMVLIFLLASLFMVAAFGPEPALSQALTILAEDAAPLSFVKEGQLTGSSVEIVRDILRRSSKDADIKVVPWARGYQTALTQPNVVLFSVARSAEREDKFHWVGPLLQVHSAFYASRTASVAIHSLEDARQVAAIGIRQADVRETFLAGEGFANLDSTNSNQSNLRKLLSGRIDLWATSNIEAANVPAQAGIDPADIKHVYTFQVFKLYIAISKQTPTHIVHEWQRALDAMKRDGSFLAISRRWLPADSLPDDVLRPSTAGDGEEDIAIYTENSPPGNYVENGHLKGPAVRIVQEILKRLSLAAPIEVVPWARGYHLAQTQPNVALFATTRLPQREAQFKWVGPLYTQRWGFYAPRSSVIQMDTLEEARGVARIGTYHEDAKEQYLKSMGFRNLVSTNNNIGNVRHLMEGRIDLWVSSDFNMPYTVRYAGYDPRQLKLVLSFKTVGNYIAFSRQTADAIVLRWQETLDELRKEERWATYFEGDLSTNR